MATTTKRSSAPRAHAETYDVTLRMVFQDTSLQGHQFEDLAVQMDEALDAHTGDHIAGVDVSGSFSPPVIEIGLDIVASSMAELHAHLSDVLGVIERQCPVTIVVDTHVERAGEQRELVCA